MQGVQLKADINLINLINKFALKFYSHISEFKIIFDFNKFFFR